MATLKTEKQDSTSLVKQQRLDSFENYKTRLLESVDIDIIKKAAPEFALTQ